MALIHYPLRTILQDVLAQFKRPLKNRPHRSLFLMLHQQISLSVIQMEALPLGLMIFW